MEWYGFKQDTHQFQPIHICMRPQELVDITVYHPFRHHRVLGISHCHSYQRQNVWVAQCLPQYDLLAKPLQVTVSSRMIGMKRRKKPTLPILS